jgi:hypothetical protein
MPSDDGRFLSGGKGPAYVEPDRSEQRRAAPLGNPDLEHAMFA